MPQAPHSAPSPHAPDNNAHENIPASPHHDTAAADDDGASDEKKRRVSARRAGVFSRAWMLGPVKRDHGDVPLLVCSFVSGLVDGASFRNWGMFVSMQTGEFLAANSTFLFYPCAGRGKLSHDFDVHIPYKHDKDPDNIVQGNTVILGLSTAGLPANPHAWLTTLISIAAFLLGAFVCFRTSKLLTPEGPTRSRLWTSVLFLTQALLLLLSAALATPPTLIPQNPRATWRATPDPEDVIGNIRIVSLIPPLAFQSGVQIATSRLLGFNELPVNVLTSTYCDLMGDFKLFATNNVRRDRRAASVGLLLLGAIVSGWMLRSGGGLMGVLWLGGGLKVVVAVAVFCFMPAVKEDLP